MENLGRVVLLMGGVSSEREVSLMSGEGVHKALVSKGVDVLKFDPKTDSLETLEKGGFDRAFIALHGRLGEDGTIQGVLNYLGIPYTGPGVTASAMAIDKDLTKRVWRSAGIPVPEGVMIDPKADDAVLEEAIACLGATGLVVKPAHDGSSIGVTKLAEPTVAALRKALEDAAGVRGDEVLVEEYIHGPNIQMTPRYSVFLIDGGEGTERIHRIFEGTQIVTDNAFLLTRCADYKDEHNVMYVPMDVPEEITPLCWLPFFQMTACRLTDDLDRWNKHPLQRAMEKFVSSKSANYVNSPFSEDTPGRG